MRKTVDVAFLLAKVNWINSTSKVAAPVRSGMNSLLETVLHEAGVYQGFSYLYEHEVPKGEKPGIIFDESPAHAHQYPDNTRVRYSVHPSIAGEYANYYDALVKQFGEG